TGSRSSQEIPETVGNEYEPFRLYFTGFPYTFNEDNIRCLFEQFGQLSDVRIVRPPNGTCIAFLTLGRKSSALKAIEALNDKMFGHQKLKLCKARPETKREHQFQSSSSNTLSWRPNVVSEIGNTTSTEQQDAVEQSVETDRVPVVKETQSIEEKCSTEAIEQSHDHEKPREHSQIVQDFISNDKFERKRSDRQGSSRTIINRSNSEPEIEMGLSCSDVVDVEVTEFESATHFWVKWQYQPDSMFDLSEAMREWYVHPGSVVTEVTLNRPYLALIDNGITRVQVIDKADEENYYRVLCVDLGYESEVDRSCLRTLLKCHSTLPANAALVSFRGITAQDLQLTTVNEQIGRLLENNHYTMKIQKCTSTSINSHFGFKITPIVIVESSLQNLGNEKFVSDSSYTTCQLDKSTLSAPVQVGVIQTVENCDYNHKSDSKLATQGAALNNHAESESRDQSPLQTVVGFTEPPPSQTASLNNSDVCESGQLNHENCIEFDNSQSTTDLLSQDMTSSTTKLKFPTTLSGKSVTTVNDKSAAPALSQSKFESHIEQPAASVALNSAPQPNETLDFDSRESINQACSDKHLRSNSFSPEIVLNNMSITVDRSSQKRYVQLQCMTFKLTRETFRDSTELLNSSERDESSRCNKLTRSVRPGIGLWQTRFQRKVQPTSDGKVDRNITSAAPAPKSASTSPLTFNLLDSIDELAVSQKSLTACNPVITEADNLVDSSNQRVNSTQAERIESDVKRSLPEQFLPVGSPIRVAIVQQDGKNFKSDFFVVVLLYSEEFAKAAETVAKFNSLDREFIESVLCRVHVPRVGDFYLVEHSPTSKFHRAQLISLDPKNSDCQVLFVDFGVTLSVSSDSLFAIPNQLASIPPQAFACCLLEPMSESVEKKVAAELKTNNPCYAVFTSSYKPGGVIRIVQKIITPHLDSDISAI
ncbi:hypothetical protein BOX15_Mlig016595g5, partial [Macrostomum lignano]